jgi:hypothetical protein
MKPNPFLDCHWFHARYSFYIVRKPIVAVFTMAKSPPVRNDRSKEALGCTVVEVGARQKAQIVMIAAATRQAVIAAPSIASPPAAVVDSRMRRGRYCAERSFLRCCVLPGPPKRLQD